MSARVPENPRVRQHIYLPARSRTPGQMPEPGDLGEGQVAVNLTDRRLWIGVANDGIVEVTEVSQLIDYWADAIERHTRPRED